MLEQLSLKKKVFFMCLFSLVTFWVLIMFRSSFDLILVMFLIFVRLDSNF